MLVAMPRTIAAIAAPGIEPSPPTTMMAISGPIQYQCNDGKMVASNANAVPPTAAVARPRPKPKLATRSVLIPTSRAASGCWMVARSERPKELFINTMYSAPSPAAASRNATILTTGIDAPKKSI